MDPLTFSYPDSTWVYLLGLYGLREHLCLDTRALHLYTVDPCSDNVESWDFVIVLWDSVGIITMRG